MKKNGHGPSPEEFRRALVGACQANGDIAKQLADAAELGIEDPLPRGRPWGMLVEMPRGSLVDDKPSGTPCRHLCAAGCGIYEHRPDVCRNYLCAWRSHAWFGSRPDYRPDKLGVMVSCQDTKDGWAITLWEVREGALDDPRLPFILDKLRQGTQDMRGFRRYPLNVVGGMGNDNMVLLPDGRRVVDIHKAGWYWARYGAENDLVARRLPAGWNPEDGMPPDNAPEALIGKKKPTEK
jgi:hypothetical protein